MTQPRTQSLPSLLRRPPPRPQKVERMQQSLHLLGAPPSNQHTVFVEDEDEAKTFDPAQYFDTPAELLDRSFNRPRAAQLADPAAVSAGADAPRVAARMERCGRPWRGRVGVAGWVEHGVGWVAAAERSFGKRCGCWWASIVARSSESEPGLHLLAQPTAVGPCVSASRSVHTGLLCLWHAWLCPWVAPLPFAPPPSPSPRSPLPPPAPPPGRKKKAAYKELLQRQERQEKLAGMVQRTAYQKELMVRAPLAPGPVCVCWGFVPADGQGSAPGALRQSSGRLPWPGQLAHRCGRAAPMGCCVWCRSAAC